MFEQHCRGDFVWFCFWLKSPLILHTFVIRIYSITKRHSVAGYFSKCNVADCVFEVNNDCIECVGLMKENMAADPAALAGRGCYIWHRQNLADLAWGILKRATWAFPRAVMSSSPSPLHTHTYMLDNTGKNAPANKNRTQNIQKLRSVNC